MVKHIGLTLIELLIGLAFLAMVLCCCIPSLDKNYQENQLQIVVVQIKNILQFARTQALLRGQTLALTPLPDANDWKKGMILFVDNPRHLYSQNSEIIHEWHWNHSAEVDVLWQGFQSRHYLLFSPTLRQSTLNGYFLIKNKRIQQKLIVNRFGKVRENIVARIF
ncbi:GspH/FimT family pseudopilin [Legionella oakridgensis]|uniref:Type II secretion system protein H n=2 Tax=Legionella oakridgensis TaxID=29423 RepID=W0B9Z0_9GAMM|nr:GspH/FimT family pseudopilin [Legionella oakridgensis]AHE67333.1 Tfp pilus assembly protein FimT [Legionella oakridgensis ATCC 33761 = DSM 21215]ETO93083.1 Tfp pilus assembly protein FimT [Legionella oakridgensis RV-2-2007]KTD37881.1 Tfp type 4 fimbrial pilin like signal peptide protein domain protein [Legionella oakridgensis]STY20397.1 Tfp type 4 fimbrial pilin like signal peptide protein domain protein [Legionella longbeachae]